MPPAATIDRTALAQLAIVVVFVARALPVLVSSLGFLGVPVVSVALSVFLLGEALTLSLVLGGGLILAGLASAALAR